MSNHLARRTRETGGHHSYLHVWMIWALLLALLPGCSPTPTPPPPTATITPTVTANWTATPSNTPTRTATPTWTPAPTRTITPTPSVTPTITPTLMPITVGTPLPITSDPIIEANLPRLQLMAQWGRGRIEGLAWGGTGTAGERIAVGTPFGVYLYDDPSTLANPRLLVTGAPAGRLSFSADGRLLAVDVASPGTGAPPGNQGQNLPPHQVQVWDVFQAKPVLLASLSVNDLVLSMAFTGPDELALLARREAGAQFQRWSLSGGSQTQAINLTGGETAVEGVFSVDLTLAATHGQSGPVRIWRLADGINLATTRETGEAAGPMSFAPDGRSLAVGYPDDKMDFANMNIVRVWDVPDGSPYAEQRFTLTDQTMGEGAGETILSVAWSPDGQMIAAGTEDHRVHIWKAVPSLAFRQLQGQSLPRFVAWAADSNRLVTGGLEVWRVAEVGGSNQQIARVEDFLPGIYDMRFVPNGSALALASFNRVELRSTLNGTLTKALTGMQGPVNSITFDPNSELMVAACQDGTARVYLVERGVQINNLGVPTYPMLAADFSPNGLWVAVAGENNLVHVYRVIDGTLMIGLIEPFVSYELAFAPNSDQFASLTTSGVRLRSIDIDIEDPTTTLEGIIGGVSLSDMAYSYDGQYLALVGNNAVRVANPATFEDMYVISQPPNATPMSVNFSPDNAFIAVGWSDGYIRLYWASDGTFMHAWAAHPEPIQRIAFTRDGRLLASQGAEGTIRIWGIGK